VKRFALYGLGLTPTEQKLWQGAGFDFAQEPAAVDLMLLFIDRMDQLIEVQRLSELRPKIFLVRGLSSEQLPECWRSVYDIQTCGSGVHRWVFGSILESPLPKDVGDLLMEEAMPALSEGLYSCLLRDVFRETAEWCGHMSSVVGRM